MMYELFLFNISPCYFCIIRHPFATFFTRLPTPEAVGNGGQGKKLAVKNRSW